MTITESVQLLLTIAVPLVCILMFIGFVKLIERMDNDE